MGVHSDGDRYGVPSGLWSSFPIRCTGQWKWEVVEVTVGEFCKEKIAASVKELS